MAVALVARQVRHLMIAEKEPSIGWVLIMVGASGLEPPTPTMSRWYSNQAELRAYRLDFKL